MKLKRMKMEFLHKSILTSGMLEEMYSYPREIERLIYNEYSDGIIHGMNYQNSQDDLILTAGIIRIKNRIYKIHLQIYSMRNSATFHPIIFNIIRQYLVQQKREKTMFDYALEMNLDMHGILPWQTVLNYKKNKTRI